MDFKIYAPKVRFVEFYGCFRMWFLTFMEEWKDLYSCALPVRGAKTKQKNCQTEIFEFVFDTCNVSGCIKKYLLNLDRMKGEKEG